MKSTATVIKRPGGNGKHNRGPKPTREGCKFLNNLLLSKITLNHIVQFLSLCSMTPGNSCEDCPDLKLCQQLFDQFCNGERDKKIKHVGVRR